MWILKKKPLNMLKEIRCNYFIKNPITFTLGLNVILGDSHSTNSIGKSTLLMILDFVFGGNTYLQKNSGAKEELGHHIFSYNFEFESENYYYQRNTEDENTVFICDKDYNIISELDLKTYTYDLMVYYKIQNELSFRSTINPYTRIWGKENYDVDKPIQNFLKESEAISIANFIKLFNQYHNISETSNKIKAENESKKILSNLHKTKYIENLTKTQFKKNEKEIERIKKEIEGIKNNLLEFTINVEELSNKELIKLKTEKSILLESQSLIQNKIKRLELNLDRKSIKSAYFNKLSEFFENPNESKIKEIELFHNKISEILNRELTATLQSLDEENNNFNTQIEQLNYKISSLLENVDSPKIIVEKIYDLTIESTKYDTANKFYQEKIDTIDNLKILNEELEKNITSILSDIQTMVNSEILKVSEKIHSGQKKIPSLKLNKKNYRYDHSSNTGTGKSYADLIEFDLAIFYLTQLPILIHDSILFKNIEDKSVDKIIEQYLTFDKQIFIALDGINRYSIKTQDILTSRSIIKLSETKKLFNRDWR